ncbi:hypothetical protein LTR62_005185 [Meristemomyces frigidus]|uniref:Uncharacterized protein n=1 Tax=Meristemomyces frigidus TaxID=1508187 RepID=A0AAN7TEK3_9PEZI|nr:hypothetical protein LTR62_005185 [Meristemomyces frigidus]
MANFVHLPVYGLDRGSISGKDDLQDTSAPVTVEDVVSRPAAGAEDPECSDRESISGKDNLPNTYSSVVDGDHVLSLSAGAESLKCPDRQSISGKEYLQDNSNLVGGEDRVPNAPAGAESMRCPDLADLARLLRLQKYKRRRTQELRNELRRMQIATERTARLARVAHSVEHTLAECVRNEDKSSFVSLFNAFHDTVLDVAGQSGEDLEHVSADAAFLDVVPETTRSTIYALANQIRNNGDFLANRLTYLTEKEILTLLPDHCLARSNNSVFESSSTSWSRASRQIGYAVDAQMDLLAAQTYGSFLETLMFSFRGSTRCTSKVDRSCLDVWSKVCARLLTEQKPGGDKLVLAVLDICAQGSVWNGKAKFELWLLQTLQTGHFLLEQPSKQSFQARMQPRSEVLNEDEIRSEQFYNLAMLRLLDALLEDIAMLIPQSALEMMNAICRLLPSHETSPQDFVHFVISRWLFPSFLFEAITLPEAGLLISKARPFSG